MENLQTIFMTICVLVCGFAAVYLQTSPKAVTKGKEVQKTLSMLQTKASEYIVKAEETYKSYTHAGSAKFEYVTNNLYEMIPDKLKPIISEEIVKQIVQSTFEQMEKYAFTQLDKVTEKIKVE